MNLHAPIRTFLLGESDITEKLGTWENEPAIHTRRPVPQETGAPFIIVASDNAGAANQDGLMSDRPVLIRDIAVYGPQPEAYRDVEAVAELIADRMHRNRFAFVVPGWHIMDVVAARPISAPTDTDKQVGRLVSLTIRLQRPKRGMVQEVQP